LSGTLLKGVVLSQEAEDMAAHLGVDALQWVGQHEVLVSSVLYEGDELKEELVRSPPDVTWSLAHLTHLFACALLKDHLAVP